MKALTIAAMVEVLYCADEALGRHGYCGCPDCQEDQGAIKATLAALDPREGYRCCPTCGDVVNLDKGEFLGCGH